MNLLESPGIKNIHFIGIGGISMSGLAEILLNLGYKISGSDINTSNITQKLENMGVKIYTYHTENNIKNPDMVVYTAAIKEDNPELKRARALNITTIDRATLLGQIMKRYPYSVAVSGTHGKTTTTSMVAMIMLESGFNPTVHVGGELDTIGGTTKIGATNYFVAEACEYCESFLKFFPYMAVILNIEFDHADYFKNIEHIKEAFLKFAMLVPQDGYITACVDDPNVAQVLDRVSCNKVTYGQISKNALWSAGNVVFDDMGCASFKLMKHYEEITDIKLSVPGIHNVSNALAAIASCYTLGCDIPSIKQALNKFHGTHRRFEIKGVSNNIKVIDDYAHHPTEVKATLRATKNFRHSKIWCVFQPHTYTRTKSLLNEFSSAFFDADTVILSDIYAARETDNGEISSKALSEKICEKGQRAIYIQGFESIVEYLKNNTSPGDIIITMGAGDIYKVGDMFLKNEKIIAAG